MALSDKGHLYQTRSTAVWSLALGCRLKRLPLRLLKQHRRVLFFSGFLKTGNFLKAMFSVCWFSQDFSRVLSQLWAHLMRVQSWHVWQLEQMRPMVYNVNALFIHLLWTHSCRYRPSLHLCCPAVQMAVSICWAHQINFSSTRCWWDAHSVWLKMHLRDMYLSCLYKKCTALPPEWWLR